ncbi:phage capsid protein [Vagococcus penaei]|uniref:phage capsid protein n=1 Tax=Vagococcus penaei TaxID=633807 RepID=UPI000F8946D6|nr:phage capsid protein [Vagococcus penaei]RSU01415.1 phage capsid protein [Vagococcus penaei]
MQNSELLMTELQKAVNGGNAVTLRDDDARAFVLDALNTANILPKLYHHFAKSGTGSIDKLGVKKRTMKKHQGLATNPDGTDIKTEGDVPFRLVETYIDTWIKNDNVVYTAQTRGQDVRQALLSMMQKQFMVDLQDLAFNGDEASSVDFLKLNDGFIVQAKKNAIVKKVGATLPTIEELTALTGEIPEEWISESFKWHMSLATSKYYVNLIQSRQTNLGDAAIVNGKLTFLGGHEVQIVESMENNVILFTPTDNLGVVFGYSVNLETAAKDSNATAKQATYHFMENDTDFVIRETKALAYIGIGTPED